MRSKYYQKLKEIRTYYTDFSEKKRVFCFMGINIPFMLYEFYSYQRLGVNGYA